MELGDLLALEPGASDRFSSLWLGYTDSLGDSELRQAITKLYQHLPPIRFSFMQEPKRRSSIS